MKTYLALALVLISTATAHAKPKLAAGMALTPDTQKPIEVVEIDLKNLSSLPVFGGYSNVNSDVNNVRFVEPICRFMGYNSVESYSVGWDINDRTPTVMIFTKNRAAYAYKMNLQTNQNIGLVRRLSCANR